MAATSGGAALSGTAMNMLGYYTLTHSVTGATMLGSTMAGSSAAGTIGIVAGTGTGGGAAGAALMNPAGIVVGVVIAAAVGGSEGYCYFQDDRITAYEDVLFVMKGLAANADPDYFALIEPHDKAKQKAVIQIIDEDGIPSQYKVEDLYIVNGVLKHRDWFLNTVIGNVGLQLVEKTNE